MIDPTTFTKRWQTGMTGAVQKIQDGITAMTDNPMTKAAAADAKYLQGVTNGVGRWKAALNAVDFNQWKTNTKDKVAQRLSGGVQAATSKMTAFGQWLLPQVQSLQATIKAMPAMTLQDSINRATAWIQGMAANPYKK